MSSLPSKNNSVHQFGPPLEMRVLQGAQAGASVALAGDAMTIGSATTCDVILVGAGVAPFHARLEAAADYFSVVAIDGSVTASAGAAHAAPWRLGTTIYIGGVAITVDHASAAWNEITAPSMASIPATGSGTLGNRPLAVRPAYKVVGVLLALVLICALISTQWPSGAQGQLSSRDLASIKTLLAHRSSSSSNMLVVDTVPQIPVVRGYLPTKKQVRTLKNEMSRWQRSIEIEVLSDEILASSSRQFLMAESSPLKISVTDGHAQLSGLSPGQEALQRLADSLHKKINGLAAVDMAFVQHAELAEWVSQWRDSQPETVHGPIRVNVAAAADIDGTQTLEGALSQKQIQKIMATLTQRSQQKNLLLNMVSAIEIRPELSGDAPLVRAFSAGPVPYVFLANGQRVMIGGLVNGFNLIAIGPSGPIFKKQGT